MGRGKKQSEISRLSVGAIAIGFAHGLAQIGSLGMVGSMAKFPKTDSTGAFHKDWQRVGGDLQRSYGKVREREKTKA